MAKEPSHQTIHLACGQIICRTGDLEHNFAQVEELTAQAVAVGVRLILFGEGALTGYVFTEENLAKALSVNGEAASRLLKLAKENDIVVAPGTLEKSKQGLHVSQFVAFPDGRLLVQRKHRLTPTEQEAGIIPGSEERELFEVDGVSFAVCICADSGLPGIRNKLAARGCQVYLGPSAGGGGGEHMVHQEDLEDPEKRKKYLQDMEKVCFVGEAMEQCAAHHMALACVNLAGDDGVSNYHPGHSAIVDSRGRLVALCPGEYVVEWLRPRMIHGEVLVQQPRTTVEQPKKED